MGISASEFLEKRKRKGLTYKESLQKRIGENYTSDIERFGRKYADDYLSSWHAKEELENYYNALDGITKQSKALQAYINRYGTDEQKASLGDLDSAISAYDQVLAGKDDLIEGYGQYDNADAYNYAKAKHEADVARLAELDAMDINAAKAELARLDKARFDQYDTQEYWDKHFDTSVDVDEIGKLDLEYEALKKKIADAETRQTIKKNEDQYLSVYTPTDEELATIQELLGKKGTTTLGKLGLEAPSYDESGELDGYMGDMAQYMTDNEKITFYNAYQANPDAAMAYYDAIENDLMLRRSNAYFNYGKENPLAGSLSSIGMNLVSTGEFVGNLFSSPDKITSSSSAASAIRSGVSSDMGKVGSFLYNTGMSAAESIIAGLAGGAIGGAFGSAAGTLGKTINPKTVQMVSKLAGSGLISGSAAASTQNDILSRGGTQEQAVVGGVAAGIFEGFFESFSIGRLQQMKPTEIVKDWKTFGANVLKEIGVNASEETATELANILFDEALMGELSNASLKIQEYMAQGMTEEEAKNKAAGDLVWQVLEAGASGAVMGFGFSALGGVGGVTKRTLAGNQFVKIDDSEQKRLKKVIVESEELFDGEGFAEQRKLLEEVKANLGKTDLNQKARIGTLVEEYSKATMKNLQTRAVNDISATVKKVQQSASAAIIGGKNADIVYDHLPEIVEFTDMKGDAIMVKNKEGESVSLSSLSLQDEELAQLYSYATTLGSVEAANSFLSSFELEMEEGKVTATEFWSDWMGIQSMGQTLGTEKARAQAFATYGGSYMSDTVKTAAFLAGVHLRTSAEHKKTEIAATYQKAWKESGGEVKQGKFDDSAIQNELKHHATEEQKQFVDFARVFSDVFGVNVTFFASKKGKRGENGRYNSKNNTIYLDLYAGIGNKSNYRAISSCLINTLSHESVHNMAAVAPTEYFALRDYVMEVLHNQEYDVESRIQEMIDGYERRGKKIDREQAIEEIVAAACEDMLGSSETVRKFMEGFYEKDKKAAEKFSDCLKKFLANLKKLFEKFIGKKSLSAEATTIAKNGVEIIAEIQKRFDEGMLALREGNLARNSAEMKDSTKLAEKNDKELRQERNRLSKSDLSDYEAKYKKRNRSNSRGSESSNISLHDESASIDSISQKSEKSTPNSKKVLEEFETELSQFRIETPEPAQVLADLFADKEAYAGYAEHKKDLVTYRNMQTIVATKEKEIAELDKNIARLRSEHRQSGKGSRMDELYQKKKRAEATVAEYKKRMFAMEAEELRAIVDAETRKAVDRMQKEQSEKYRAKSRARTEQMKMSERRAKLKKIIHELDTLLNRANKKKNVKEGMQDTVSAALKLANLLTADELTNADIVRMGDVDSLADDQEEKYLHEYRALLAQKEALEKELSEMSAHPQAEESFSDQVDAVLGGKDTTSTHLKVGETPALLRKAGLPNLPILMTAKHLKTITGENGTDGRNYHGLDVEIVKRLPEYLSDPVLIADSLTRDDSIVVLTEAVDSQNRPVIAAIKLQGQGRLSGKHITANIMTSAYGKDNIQSFLQKIADASATTYWNAKKSQEMSVSLGVQFPNAITSLDSDTIIRQVKAFVKTNGEKASKNYDAIDRKDDSISKVDRRIKELDRELKNLFEREKRRTNRVDVDKILDELANAYKEIQNADEEYLRQAYSEYVANRIDSLKSDEEIKGKSVKSMTEAQLQEIYDLYRAVLKTVKDANKAFNTEFSQNIVELADTLGIEIQEQGKGEDKVWRVKQWLRSFSWKMLTPIYAVDVIGSQTMKKLFYSIVEAEGIWARDVQEAQAFMRQIDHKYGTKDWEFDKQHKFRDQFGKEFSLTLDQIMSIYAHTRQGEEAENHLDVGGFTQSKDIKVKDTTGHFKNKIWTYGWNTSKSYRLSPEIRAAIISHLSEKQKSYVEEMQAYLSDVLGEKGNEVSKKLYGIRIFNKKIYFPLRSADQYIIDKEADRNPGASPKLKNWGASKERSKGAVSPIVLDGFRDVWASHSAEMASYHAFTLPLEDFSRVFNYGRRGDSEKEVSSVQATMENVFGIQSVRYYRHLIDRLNGDVRVDNTVGFANKFVGLAKTGATALSLSTLVQQPTAMLRAMAMLDPKYFVTHAKFIGHAEQWEEIKKYAPIAALKEMGGYDTGVGVKTTDWIKQNEYQGIKEKGKALITDSSYRNEKIFALPALADELSWCHIWAAVKKETADKTDFAVDSEEFLQACGERFTDIVMHTQVYDSVLARSALMRSKDSGAKMLSAFAAEPTVFMNMVAYGTISGKRGDKKMCARFIGSSVASMMVNAAVVALVYAARDDDEDEGFAEKYVQSLTTELIEGFNPITYIPFLRDIWSTFLGYDVERMDMSLFADFSQSLEGLWSTRKTPWKKWTDFVGDLAKIFGIPLGNLLREGTAIFNLIKMIVEGEIGADSDELADAFVEGAKDSVPLLDRILK